jgi:hypothetical protein
MEGGEAVTLASIGANLVRFQAAAHKVMKVLEAIFTGRQLG